MKDVKDEDIKLLIELFDQSDWKEFSLQIGDFSIFLSRDPQCTVPAWLQRSPPVATAPVAAQAGGGAGREAGEKASGNTAPPTPKTAGDTDPPAGAVVVRAPNLGIFYRSPKPGAPPYAEVGQKVEPDTEICLIEVMKLFTPVTAGTAGEVLKVCAEDGEMIEHGQPLFWIRPVD